LNIEDGFGGVALREDGGADFVRKPFSMEALAKKIQETLTTSAGGLS
jgi:FixJ family two-component response regulator